MANNNKNPVLIVGAGPTGLVLAIELARRNIPFRLIDRLAKPLTWERAIFLKSRTLEIFDDIGIVDAVLKQSEIVEGIDIYLDAEKSASYRFSGLDSPYPYIASVPQDVTEGLLADHLTSLGGSIERGIEFVDLITTDHGARVKLREGDHETWFEAGWVVGTDGLHSAVRDVIGVAFEGHDYPRLWGVVDAEISGWDMPPRIVTPQLKPPVVIPFPLKDGRKRIYFHPDKAHPDALLDVAERLKLVSPNAALINPDEPRFFHSHSRIAHHFRKDSVLVAGDAAHASNPIEGHGMNAGIQDAYNLGWKLALIMEGAPADLLTQTYEAERQYVARALIQSGDEMETRIEPGNDPALNELITFLSTNKGRELAALAESEITFAYEQNPIIREFGSPPEPTPQMTPIGGRVGDAAGLIGTAGSQNLMDRLKGKHAILLALLGKADPGTIEAALESTKSQLAELPRHPWFGPQTAIVIKGDPPAQYPSDTLLYDTTGVTHNRLSGDRPTYCLIRPDGHLGLRFLPSAFPQALATLESMLPKQD